MGGQQSARSTEFTNESAREMPTASVEDDDDSENHISISNKMVERLVEDALATGGTATATVTPCAGAGSPARIEPKRDRDKILAQKLQDLDNTHSERLGLTIEEVRATARRVEKRAECLLRASAPVCQDCHDTLIECYEANTKGDAYRCTAAVDAFTKCVHETAVERLRERTAQDAVVAARLTRHMAHARESAFKDVLGAPPPKFGPPPPEVPS